MAMESRKLSNADSGEEEQSLLPGGGAGSFFSWVLVALACLGGLLFGYDTGIISGSIVLIDEDFDLSDWQIEMIVGATVVGAMISSLSSGVMCDYFGRRLMVLLAAMVFIAGAVVMAAAPDYVILIVGRFIVGLGVGSASMNMPVIISEMAEASIRGMLVTCINVAITFGQFAACLVAGALSPVPSGWRYMLGLAAVPAAVQFVGFLFMPESPRYLVQTSRSGEAASVLRKLRGRYNVDDELRDIIAAVRKEDAMSASSENYSFSSQMAIPATRRALLLGCFLQLAQQIGGINTIMYYSATILKLSGFTSNTQVLWLSAVVAFFNFFGSCIGLRLVDRIGRRLLMLSSQLLVTCMLVALSAMFYFAQVTSVRLDDDAYKTSFGAIPDSHCSSYKFCFDCVQDDGCGYCSQLSSAGQFSDVCISNSDDDAPTNSSLCTASNYDASACPGSGTMGWLIFMFLCLYLLVFAPGMGPMPWCINSEIYSNSFRSRGNSIATGCNWSGNILMSLTFLTFINVFSKQGAFLVYAGLTMAFLLFFYKYLPETKNLPLEDVTRAFDDDNWGHHVYFTGNRESSGNGVYGTDSKHAKLGGDRPSSASDEDEFESSFSCINESLLKTKYFEDSGSSRHHSSFSRESGELSGLLHGEISYSTVNDGSQRDSIVDI